MSSIVRILAVPSFGDRGDIQKPGCSENIKWVAYGCAIHFPQCLEDIKWMAFGWTNNPAVVVGFVSVPFRAKDPSLPVSTAADVHVSPAMHAAEDAPLSALCAPPLPKISDVKISGNGRQIPTWHGTLIPPPRESRNQCFFLRHGDDHRLANRINAAPTSVGLLQSVWSVRPILACNLSAVHLPRVGLYPEPYRLHRSTPRAHSRCPRPLRSMDPFKLDGLSYLTIPTALIGCRDEYLTVEP